MTRPDDGFHVYDTTLRDGAQREGISYSVADKLAVARLLDELGVGFIEGGWPGAMPKDTEFFARATNELDLRSADLVAFGATRRAGSVAADDAQVRALLDASTPVVTLVAKSDVRHVTEALRTTLDENLAMVSETVELLVGEGRRVFLDLEHFFDGYRNDRDYGLRVLDAARDAGADVAVLCDTNGGMLPLGVHRVVSEVLRALRWWYSAGHPLPGRHRVRRGEHAGGRRGRCDACAVHRERLRRTDGQRRPVRGRGQPRDQARHEGAAARSPHRAGARLARPRRDRQHRPRHPPGLRRGVGVRPQGGTARQRDQGLS